MFVRSFKNSVLAGTIISASIFGMLTTTATANDTATVPLTVTLTNVRASDVPLYISVQTKETFRSMKGEGSILKKTNAGDLTRTFDLKIGGDYAVSVWHDLDNDGRFSMTESYEIIDGWGASGTLPEGSAPTFDDAKVNVPSFGAATTISMIYPKG